LRLAAYAVVYWIVCGLARHLGRFRFAAIAPVVVVAAIESAVAVAQQFSGEAARGSYFNRNHLAGLLEMSLPFAVVAAVTMGRDTARRSGTFSIVCAAGGAAVLILSGILATRSRAALLAVSASLLVLGAGAVASLVRLRRKWLLAALPPALLAAGLLYLTPESLVRRYGALAGRENLLREGRVLLWSETLDLIAAYPLVGCGFGGYEAAFLRYKQSEPMVTDTHAHNDYLELLAEAGVIGFALCVALVVPVTVAALRKSQQPGHAETSLALACVGSLTAILVHSFVDFNLRIPANGMVFCWVLGVCRAVSAREAA